MDEKAQYFVLSDGQPVDSSGVELDLDEDGVLQLAHPIEMKRAELDAWKIYFACHDLMQPFPQLEIALLQVSTSELERRYRRYYKGVQVPKCVLRQLDKDGFEIFPIATHAGGAYMLSLGSFCMVFRLADGRFIAPEFRWLDPKAMLEYSECRGSVDNSRILNHIVVSFDKAAIYSEIAKDKPDVGDKLDAFGESDIDAFLQYAIKNERSISIAFS